jgi:hypothetical protein
MGPVVTDPDSEPDSAAALGEVRGWRVGEVPCEWVDDHGAVLRTRNELVGQAIAIGIDGADVAGDHAWQCQLELAPV